MSKSNQVLKTIGKVSGLMLIQKMSNFISMIILMRLLTPYEFGVVAAALIIIEFANMLPSVGIPFTLIQRKELSDKDIRVSFTLLLIISISIYVILVLSRNVTADVMGISDLRTVLPIFAISILLDVFSNMSNTIMQRENKVYQLAAVQTACICAATFFVTIPLAYYGFGYQSLIIGHLVQSFCVSAALFFISRFPLSLHWQTQTASSIFKHGFGFFFIKFLSIIPSKVDSLIIGSAYGARDLGYYARAYRLMDYPNAIYQSSAGRVIFPAMARMQDNPEKLLNILKRGLNLTATFAMPIAVIIGICHYEIVTILLGKQWEKTGEILAILSFFIFFRINWNVFSVYFRSQGLIKILTINSVVNAILSVIIIYAASQYSLIAVAWGSGIAITLAWTLMLIQVVVYTKRNVLEFLECFTGPIIISAGLAVILTAFRGYFADSMSVLNLLLSEILITLIYGSALWASKSKTLLGRDVINVIEKVNLRIKKRIC